MATLRIEVDAAIGGNGQRLIESIERSVRGINAQLVQQQAAVAAVQSTFAATAQAQSQVGAQAQATTAAISRQDRLTQQLLRGIRDQLAEQNRLTTAQQAAAKARSESLAMQRQAAEAQRRVTAEVVATERAYRGVAAQIGRVAALSRQAVARAGAIGSSFIGGAGSVLSSSIATASGGGILSSAIRTPLAIGQLGLGLGGELAKAIGQGLQAGGQFLAGGLRAGLGILSTGAAIIPGIGSIAAVGLQVGGSLVGGIVDAIGAGAGAIGDAIGGVLKAGGDVLSSVARVAGRLGEEFSSAFVRTATVGLGVLGVATATAIAGSRTQAPFDFVAQNRLGQDPAALISQLQDASGGTLSRAAIRQVGLRALPQGISSEDFGVLLEGSRRLAPTQGYSVQQGLEATISGILRNSIRLIDNLQPSVSHLPDM